MDFKRITLMAKKIKSGKVKTPKDKKYIWIVQTALPRHMNHCLHLAGEYGLIAFQDATNNFLVIEQNRKCTLKRFTQFMDAIFN